MIRKMLLVTINWLIVFSASAQDDTVMSAPQLSFISRTMYDEGNINYMVVDALRDSLLSFGEPYTIMMNSPAYLAIMRPGKTRLPGETGMPVHLRQQYFAKFEKFLELQGETGTGFIVIRSDAPLTKSMVLDVASEFRSSPELHCFRAGLQQKGKHKLVLQMLKDKIVTLDDPAFELIYGEGRIVVNSRPLQNEQLAWYRNYFQHRLGINIDDGQSGRWYYEKGPAEVLK